MERAKAPKFTKPPDNSKWPLKLPRVPNIVIDGYGNVTIAPSKEEEFKVLKLSFEAFERIMTSSLAHLESISICNGIGFGPHFSKLCQVLKTMPLRKDLKLNLRDARIEWVGPIIELLSEGIALLNLDLAVPWMDELEAKLLVDVLLQNQTLQTLKLSIGILSGVYNYKAIKHLCRYLKSPTNVLEHLEIHPALRDVSVKKLAEVLASNTRLTYLHFGRGWRGIGPFTGVGDIADALHLNHSLETLVIYASDIQKGEMEKLVGALVPSSNPKASLSHLEFVECGMPEEGFEQLATMMEWNTSLVHLGLRNCRNLTSSVMKSILISLQSNHTLQYLDLRSIRIPFGTMILGSIMDMLLQNHTIKWIDLDNSSLDDSGDAQLVYAELRKREKDYQHWCAVANMAPISPDSARIFLCGNGEAGKTTLCQKWERKKKRSMIAKMLQKRNLLASVRTRGIEVNNMVWGDMNISVWDMAGQEEYHSFHDLVVPNDIATGSCCMYFIVCNPFNKSLHNIRAEIHYWLKFVSSNTRRSESYRPSVTILMTHLDLWREDQLLTDHLKELIVELKDIFIDHLTVDGKMEFVAMDNGIGKSSDALDLKLFATDYLKTLSTRVPKVLKASKDLQLLLTRWNIKNPNRPFVDWETFSEICEEVDELKSFVYMDETALKELKKKKQYVATSLHEGGHIMYFEDLNTIIMNPRWFCHDIMGNMLFKCSKLNPKYAMITNGITSQKHLEMVFLDSIDLSMYKDFFDDCLGIMMKLKICYEDANGSILIPSLFLTTPTASSSWPSRMVNDGSSYNFIGTSLASKEPTATMLTAGFFPRLQVHLEKFVPGVAKRSYKLSKDTISYTHRDSDVHIEYKNDRIDILSRSLSTKGYKWHKEVIKSINDLRSSSMLGCTGVDFEESIVRPYCVQHLSPYEGRWNQVVSRRELKQVVTDSGDLNYQHHWEENGELSGAGGFDCAESLLSQDDWEDILKSRLQTLEMVEKAVTSKLSKDRPTLEEDDVVSDIGVGGQCSGDPSETDELKKYLDNKFQMLHLKLDHNHDEVKGILGGLKKDIMERQDVLYSKFCSNVCALMEFSVQLIQSRVPKYPVFVPDDTKNMFKQMIPGLTSGRLYFFCEHRGGFHLARQRGLGTSYGTSSTRKFGILLFWGLSVIIILLKVGAHLGAGMGDMVPYPQLKAFMTMLDTPGLLDMAQPSGPMLEFLPDDLKRDPTIARFDNQAAEDWLVEYLQSKCGTGSSIHEKLGLNKVVYVDRSGETSDSKQRVAWVCDEHLEQGKRNGTLRPLGNSF